jgi:ferric-dicitrate binding protein FerR (iron transport regulator)
MKNTEDIFKVIAGNAETDTKRSVLSSLEEEQDAKEEYNRLKNSWALLASEKEMSSYQIENLYLNFKDQLKSKKHPRILNFNTLLRYAAIFIFAVGLSTLYFHNQNSNQLLKTTGLFEASVVAENGQRSKIVLPDSSVVWLNSGTIVSYSRNFAIHDREIKLSGQAFFQVTKNKDIPFVVNCDNLKVKVLGTRFDVNAYSDNGTINVALESGSVELLHSKNESFHYKIVPGEMAQYDVHTNNVVIKEVNIDQVTGWKEGILSFKDSPMKEVILQLERKYNVEIEVKNPIIYQSVFTATIKNETLDEVIRSIEYACSIHCNIIRSGDKSVKTKVEISK